MVVETKHGLLRWIGSPSEPPRIPTIDEMAGKGRFQVPIWPDPNDPAVIHYNFAIMRETVGTQGDAFGMSMDSEHRISYTRVRRGVPQGERPKAETCAEEDTPFGREVYYSLDKLWQNPPPPLIRKQLSLTLTNSRVDGWLLMVTVRSLRQVEPDVLFRMVQAALNY